VNVLRAVEAIEMHLIETNSSSARRKLSSEFTKNGILRIHKQTGQDRSIWNEMSNQI